MKQRQLLWLGAALVVLLGLAYITGVFDADYSTVEVPQIRIPRDQLEMIRADEVTLRKEEGRWRVVEPIDAPADSSTVDRLVEELSTLELQSVVSRNPERYGRYGVDSTARQVTVRWTGGEHALVVGDQAGFSGNYLRLEGDEAVYLTSSRLRVPEELEDWRDRTIVRLEPRGVRGFAINGPDRSIALERRDEGWASAADGSPADSAAAERYLDRFASLVSDGFFNEAPAASDSSYSVRFTLDEGTERRLEFVPADEDYAVLVDGGPTAFRLRASRLSQYVPEDSYFVP